MKRYSGKLSKKEISAFNSFAEERFMAIKQNKLLENRDTKLLTTVFKPHIIAVIFNGIVDAYKAGQKSEKDKWKEKTKTLREQHKNRRK